jgi:hypothetical protein
MDTDTNFMSLANQDTAPLTDFFRESDDLVTYGDGSSDPLIDLSSDFNAIQNHGPSLPADLDAFEKSWFSSLEQPELPTNLDFTFELDIQHDLNDHSDFVLPNIDRSTMENAWLLPTPPTCADDLVQWGEDASTLLANINTTSTIETAPANFMAGFGPLGFDACDYGLTPQVAQCAPQPQHHMERQHMYDEASHSPKRRWQSNEAPESDHEVKVARTSITSSAKEVLMQAFQIDPYLKPNVSKVIRAKTQLPTKTIRTWYMNEIRRNKSFPSK